MIWQGAQPIYVTVTAEPGDVASPGTTAANVILGSLGLAGFLLIVSLFLGGLLAWWLVSQHRRHPPEANHLPPVSPSVVDSTRQPSSPTR